MDHPQVVGHGPEDPGGQPPPGLLVDGGPGREVVGHVPPLAAGLDQPAQGVEHLPQVLPPLRGARPHQGPVVVIGTTTGNTISTKKGNTGGVIGWAIFPSWPHGPSWLSSTP